MFGLKQIIQRMFGTYNERKLTQYLQRIERINNLEESFKRLDDDALKAKTQVFRRQLAEGKTLDDILEPVFATIREVAWRVLRQRHFDVQLIGGMVLHEGKIAEMKTGEGKTLSSTLPCYLNALTELGVHVVTVNDYLALRDSQWMGKIYEFLGLTVGCLVNDMGTDKRQIAYQADITYGTNNEFGFDYLRDNMQYSRENMVQRTHAFAIIDEVDSILIDEARTPLIISGETADHTPLYVSIDKLIPELEEKDYEIDDKTRSVSLTDDGNDHVEKMLQDRGLMDASSSIYDIHNVMLVHHVTNALRAYKIFVKDRDYIMKDNQVVLIDEFTGRMMSGRRYSDGLHQALEAKEGAEIASENQTLSSITFQNYFRLYKKLSGMTGTAMTEAEEFMDIYHLDVVEIPTNTPIDRCDRDDEIYRTENEKITAMIEVIETCKKRGQPVLVGTTSIEKSEALSLRLKKKNIKHNVLNARYHEQEAHIIAQAGTIGAITIATNMAGRGTDIQLGGHMEMLLEQKISADLDDSEIVKIQEEVIEQIRKDKQIVQKAGGLYIIGTERHESRRIDNQLRGRSGRQGDKGESLFFLSLEDDLMRIFGTDKMDAMLQKLGFIEGESIVHPWISKALERAQMKVEARNFDLRKNILKFDDVMNEQRKAIFQQRLECMDDRVVSDNIKTMRSQIIDHLVSTHIPEKTYPEQWDMIGLSEHIMQIFNVKIKLSKWIQEEGIDAEIFQKRLNQEIEKIADERFSHIDSNVMNDCQKAIMLQIIDQHWREHLATLEHLRQVVGLRGYGQRDPLSEYKLEAFTLFSNMLDQLKIDITRLIMAINTDSLSQYPQEETENERGIEAEFSPIIHQEPIENKKKIPRNAPCPCGSGKKYKRCCGAV